MAMNFKISSIRKSDGKELYFADDENMEKYINENGGEDAFEFNGFQQVHAGEEIIDYDEWARDAKLLLDYSGINYKNFTLDQLHGIDTEDTEEAAEQRSKDSVDPRNRYAVYKVKENGELEETDEDIVEFTQNRYIDQLKEMKEILGKKLEERGITIADALSNFDPTQIDYSDIDKYTEETEGIRDLLKQKRLLEKETKEFGDVLFNDMKAKGELDENGYPIEKGRKRCACGEYHEDGEECPHGGENHSVRV